MKNIEAKKKKKERDHFHIFSLPEIFMPLPSISFVITIVAKKGARLYIGLF